MITIDTIRACSRWDTSAEMPPVVEFKSATNTVSHSRVCPRHGGTECLATYRIERKP